MRLQCGLCKRWLQDEYRRGHHGADYVRKIVNTYFDTRGSYRRTADALDGKLSHTMAYRMIDRLGRGCKSPVTVALELHPQWSGMLGCDGKVIKIRRKEWILPIAADIETQDVVDWRLVKHEDYWNIEAFLREVRDEIDYEPKEIVIDLDPAWREAVENVFPNTPIQLCVVHFERIVDRTIPKLKRTPKQHELKMMMIRSVLYAESEAKSRSAYNDLMDKRGLFRGKKSKYVIRSLKENHSLLATHFKVDGSSRSNNVAESINDKIEMRLKMIRGYKKVRMARNSLKLIIMHYRFKPFSSCKKKEHNHKSPLNLAGVNTSKLNWITYSQKDTSIINAL